MGHFKKLSQTIGATSHIVWIGLLKGRTAIRIFNRFQNLKDRPYWSNHFWARGYCVDTVGLESEMIRKYIKYQDNKDKD